MHLLIRIQQVVLSLTESALYWDLWVMLSSNGRHIFAQHHFLPLPSSCLDTDHAQNDVVQRAAVNQTKILVIWYCTSVFPLPFIWRGSLPPQHNLPLPQREFTYFQVSFSYGPAIELFFVPWQFQLPMICSLHQKRHVMLMWRVLSGDLCGFFHPTWGGGTTSPAEAPPFIRRTAGR